MSYVLVIGLVRDIPGNEELFHDAHKDFALHVDVKVEEGYLEAALSSDSLKASADALLQLVKDKK